MKKYLLGLVAVVIAVGLSAFTSAEKQTKTSDNFTSYYWFDLVGIYTGFKTKPAEMVASTCQDNSVDLCRNGYIADDLLDPAHPEFGLNQDAEVRESITKSN